VELVGISSGHAHYFGQSESSEVSAIPHKGGLAIIKCYKEQRPVPQFSIDF